MSGDLRKVMKAMVLAIESHHGQKRKYTGEPYIVHPMNVVEILFAITEGNCTSDMIAAAWLHDVLEDTETSPSLIKMLCGDGVLKLVEELTDKSKPKDGNRAARKKIDREALWAASEEAQIIKCADMISNAHSIFEYDKDFWKVYVKEKLDLLSGFRDNEAKKLALDVVIRYKEGDVR
jgi:(p)ppGpp synthase/HD superfamily hydrolase